MQGGGTRTELFVNSQMGLSCLADAALMASRLGMCRWSVRVLEEFFAQGDRERAAGLPVSPMMDRTSTSHALSQINFIEFIVAPLFSQARDTASWLHTWFW